MAVHAADFSDTSVSSLIEKAQAAFDSGDYDEALAYSSQCTKLHRKEAEALDRKHRIYGTTSEDTQRLNLLGKAFYLQALAWQKKGELTKAKAGYEYIVNNLTFSRAVKDAQELRDILVKRYG